MPEQTVVPRPVPMHLWGKDHWSTLAYVAHVATGAREIDKDKMRTNEDRHPHGVGFRQRAFASGPSKEYPTRLRGGTELLDHDDWDCLEDAVAAGLLTWGTWTVPWVVLTDTGLEAFSQILAHENDPACKSWTKAMQGWSPSPENRGLAENGDAMYMALHGQP